MVHQAIVEPSRKTLERRLGSPEVNLHREALVGARLESTLEPLVEGASANIRFGACGRSSLALTARAQGRGLLVLREIFDPGWRTTVNGKPARIYEVDGALCGVVVPRGESRVVMRYSPWFFWLGSFPTAGAFFGTFLAAFLAWRRSRTTSE